MAMIGRNAAIAEVGKHRHQVEGPLALAAWLGVHAMLLSGTHSKADAFLTWPGTTSTATTPPPSKLRRCRNASPGATTTRTSRTSHSTGPKPPMLPTRHETHAPDRGTGSPFTSQRPVGGPGTRGASIAKRLTRTARRRARHTIWMVTRWRVHTGRFRPRS